MGTTSRHFRCFVPEDNAMMLLLINTTFARKRGVAKNLLLAVTFNGAAWRCQPGSDPRFISIVEEAFVNTNLLMPPVTTPLWRPGGVPGEWSDVCGFFKPPGFENESTLMLGWLIVYHETTHLTDQIRERGTHRTTTAKKEGKTVNT